MGEGKHLRFTVEAGGARARGVAFGTGGRLPVAAEEPAEATFTLEINEWNGVSEPRLVLRQARAREQLVAEPGRGAGGARRGRGARAVRLSRGRSRSPRRRSLQSGWSVPYP